MAYGNFDSTSTDYTQQMIYQMMKIGIIIQ